MRSPLQERLLLVFIWKFTRSEFRMVISSKSVSRDTCLVVLGLALVTFALYWPVRHYDFVEYDDPEYVSENQTVRNGLTWDGLVWSFVDAHASNWHPVTWLSHMLDCQLFGLHPGAHHMVNLVLHAANAALLFLLLRSMTGAFWRSAIVAALFAWHPLRVESVAWISERKDVLSGFFFMLTLWSYSKYASCRAKAEPGAEPVNGSPPNAGLSSPSSNSWYYTTLAFFVMGLLSKPMLVTVPMVMLLLDYWPLKRWSGGLLPPRIPMTLLREKLPFLCFAMLAALLTVFAQKSSGAMIALDHEGPWTRLATATAGFLQYLGKIAWPRDLACLYLRPGHTNFALVTAAMVVLVSVSALAWLNLRKRPYAAVGWLWYVGMMLPVSGVCQVGLQSIADRYTYLPAIGLAIAAVWGIHELIQATALSKVERLASAGLAMVCLAACALLTSHQVSYWRNTQTLMTHALRIDPNNYVAHQNLGRYFAEIGQPELAREHRQKLRELDPVFVRSTDRR
jgi:protein O-mannosyl-transferase